MKWLALLLGSVILVVVAWLLLSSGVARGPLPTLQIPLSTAGKEDLIAAAAQLEKYQPTPANVAEGVRLLAALHDRLSEEDWASVQRSAFIGWDRVRRTPGSHQGIAPLAEGMFSRLARWGSKEEIELLIRAAERNDYWKPQINLGLSLLAKVSVPASGYRGSRLETLVSAALKAGDYDLAYAALRSPAWAEGTSDEARKPALRLERILSHYLDAKAGKPSFVPILELWMTQPVDAEVRMVAERAGVRIARNGRASKDWSLVRRGIAETQSLSGASNYWRTVAWGIAEETGNGVSGEEGTLQAILGGRPDEADLWEALGMQCKEKDYPSAAWRATCLEHVIRATEDPARREAALGKLIAERIPFDDSKLIRKLVEELRSTVGDEGTTRALVVADGALRQKEQEAAYQRDLETRGQAFLPLRIELETLQQRLAGMKAAKRNPAEIKSVERRIQEIEKLRPQ